MRSQATVGDAGISERYASLFSRGNRDHLIRCMTPDIHTQTRRATDSGHLSRAYSPESHTKRIKGACGGERGRSQYFYKEWIGYR
jgi:hypothetical protein